MLAMSDPHSFHLIHLNITPPPHVLPGSQGIHASALSLSDAMQACLALGNGRLPLHRAHRQLGSHGSWGQLYTTRNGRYVRAFIRIFRPIFSNLMWQERFLAGMKQEGTLVY